MALTEQQYQDAAQRTGLNKAHIKAFETLESKGDGFLPNGEVKILFERHVFYRCLVRNRGKVFADTVAKQDPDICDPKPYGKGGYGKESQQHSKLQRATVYDRNSALEGCSWGRFQVLGENWKDCGYPTLQAFINDAFTEKGQLNILIGYLLGKPAIIKAMLAKNWKEVARLYNGPDYATYKYDVQLSDAYVANGGK